jgi:hypothetical protein
MLQNDTTTERAEFDPVLSMAIADTWWELGKRLSPFVGDAVSSAQKAAALEDWVAEILKARSTDEEREVDRDIVSALTPERLGTFVETALALLERKYNNESIARDVHTLIKEASCDVVDAPNRRLEMPETPDAFWAWEYLSLFTEMRSSNKSDWTIAVGNCEKCKQFFVKTRSDQRFHNDTCRKEAANVRFREKAKSSSDKSKARRPSR